MNTLTGRVDLHTHSSFSDGTLTPTELVKLAAQTGLSSIALTDHDTTDGVCEALAAADRYGVEVIPGVELSTDYYGKDIHIVGLFIDFRDEAFTARLHALREEREARNGRMAGKLTDAGFPMTIVELHQEFRESVLTRAHFARFMMSRGYVSTIVEAFEKYIGEDCPCYVPREKVTPQDAVRMILRHHGIPVLAHPMQYKLGDEVLRRLVGELKDAGLAGIEVRYCTHTEEEVSYLSAIAEEFGLMKSGGSDFHGENKPGLSLGTGYGDLEVPAEYLTAMKHRLHGITSDTKVFFSDFDGTLVNSRRELMPAVRDVLQKWSEAGNRFVLISGRALSNVLTLAEEKDLHYPGMFLCGFNGTGLYDCERSMTLYHTGIDLAICEEVCRIARENGIHFQTYEGKHILCEHDDEALAFYVERVQMPVIITDDVMKYQKNRPGKILAIELEQPEKLEVLRAQLHERFPDDLEMFYSNPNYLEIVPKGINKGTIVRWLCRELGLPIENAIAAGDSENDLEMIRAAGCGILMKNGAELYPSMREAADLITEQDCDHDGFAPELMKMI